MRNDFLTCQVILKLGTDFVKARTTPSVVTKNTLNNVGERLSGIQGVPLEHAMSQRTHPQDSVTKSFQQAPEHVMLQTPPAVFVRDSSLNDSSVGGVGNTKCIS